MQQLIVVTTGGTIDKIYFDEKSEFQIGAPAIGEILGQLGVAFEFHVIPLLRKDSLHLTDADRALIRDRVAALPQRHVLVTHGTDTMVDTARVLHDLPGKVVVLTGALNPARFQGSDAVFNIGCAVGAPFAVLVAEELFASGCRWLLSLTSAGQIVAAGPTPYFVIIDRALRADGVRVAVFRQVRSGGGEWQNAQVQPETPVRLEEAILMRARQLRSQSSEGN